MPMHEHTQVLDPRTRMALFKLLNQAPMAVDSYCKTITISSYRPT